MDFLPKIKLETVVSDSISLNQATAAIIKAAKTGKIGDGKIFVSNVDAGRAHPHRRDRRKSRLTSLNR